ncbi:TPA: hypothetical protein HMW13_28965, partial [Escherichia coli]|nr:hypothetical protein [Escherichia coli]
MLIPATLYVAFQRGHYKQLAEFTKWAQKEAALRRLLFLKIKTAWTSQQLLLQSQSQLSQCL